MKRIINFIVSFAMVLSVFMLNIGTADASTSRVAKISNVEGTVEIQKSGGKRIIIGYKDMNLHEGDILSTGSNSSAVLHFSNGTAEDDTLIVESNTTVTLSKLSNKSGTITKINLKKGKAWVDVKSIKQQQDRFEFLTPTANMSVRGTNFFVGIDPNTGQSILSVFSGLVNYNSRDNQFNAGQYIYPSQLAYYEPDKGQIVGNMSNESIGQLLANTSTEIMKAILANLNKIQQENEELLGLLRDSNVIDNNLSDEVLKTNIERIIYAVLQEAKNKNLINDSQFSEAMEALQKNAMNQGQQPQTNLETNGENNDRYDFILQQKTQQMLDRLKQQSKENELAELKRKQQLEEQRRLELEKKQQELLEKFLNSMTPEQRQAYLLRNRELLGIQEPAPTLTPEATPDPAPTPQPSPSPEPAPEPGATAGWNDYALPLQLQLDELENIRDLKVIYESISGSYQFEQPMSITKGAILRVKPKFLDALEVIEVKVNGQNVEMNSETKSYHIEVETVPTAFHIFYKVKHAQLGERSFELDLNLLKKTIGWANVEQPLKINFEDNHIAKEISYQFSKQEQAGVWSGNMQVQEVHSVKEPTTIQLTPAKGFKISEIVYNDQLTTGDTITIAKPIGQKEVVVKLTLEHDEFGEISVTLLMNFINEYQAPFQIFKGNDLLETNEYQEVLLDSQNYLPKEVQNEHSELKYYVKLREDIEIVSLYKYSSNEIDPFQLESDSEGYYWITVHEEDWNILNDGGSVYYELIIKDPETLQDTSYRMYLNSSKVL